MADVKQNGTPWNIDHARFPHTGTVREQLAFCVNYAVLAPSIHNTQPWLFRLNDSSIELWFDRSRLLSATDPSGREGIISCGAALSNLQVALNRFGYEAWVQYVPESDNPDLLARVRPGRHMVPDYCAESLFQSVTRRRSVRRPFQNRPVPRDLQRRLIWKASEFGCWVHFVESEPDRERIARLVRQAQSWQLEDTAYQEERVDWMAPVDPLLHDDGDAASNGTLAKAAGTRWLERDRELIRSSPVLFTLGTVGDSIIEWIQAGETIQQILLMTTAENVSASFLNQPCQISSLREELRSMTGRTGPPQLLLRMGYSDEVDPTSRRPVEDVIVSVPGDRF